MSQDRTYLWKSHWKQLGWACKLGGVWSQGIPRAWYIVGARLMMTQIWHLPAGSVGGGLSKGTMASDSTSIWEKVAPPALSLKTDSSVPPVMSLAPF